LPVLRLRAAEERADDGEGERETAALGNQLVGRGGELIGWKTGPGSEELAGLGRVEEAGAVLLRAEPAADGLVAGGEEEAGARGVGEERLDIGNAPDVVEDDEDGAGGQEGAVGLGFFCVCLEVGEVLAEGAAMSLMSWTTVRVRSRPAVIQTMPSGKARWTTSSSVRALARTVLPMPPMPERAVRAMGWRSPSAKSASRRAATAWGRWT